MKPQTPQVGLAVEGTEPPLFTKAYDLVVWLYGESLQFPRVHRLHLAPRLHDSAVGLMLDLAAARYSPARRATALSSADLRLEELRLLLRLAKDLRIVSTHKYLSGAERLREVGKMIGGWMSSPRRA